MCSLDKQALYFFDKPYFSDILYLRPSPSAHYQTTAPHRVSSRLPMDHYPTIRVNERETPNSRTSSRHDSVSSIGKGATTTRGSPTRRKMESSDQQSYSYHSFPSPSSHSPDSSSYRSNSTTSDHSNFRRIEEQYSRYTNAPPPYSKKQYEGKTDDEKTSMRMKDYTKELSRMMTRQLVRGLKIAEREKAKTEVKK